MRSLLTFSISIALLFNSCSKEEHIPFEESLNDTIPLVYYHDLSGEYEGDLSVISFVNETSYVVLSSVKHTVVIEEIEFSILNFKNISNLVEGDVNATVQRFENGALYRTDYGKTPPNLGIDTVFSDTYNDYYNGIWLPEEGDLIQYFINYTDSSGVIHQVFEGNLVE